MDGQHVAITGKRLEADDGPAREQLRWDLEGNLDRALGALRDESCSGCHAERLAGFAVVERALDAVALARPEPAEGDGVDKRDRLVHRAHHR